MPEAGFAGRGVGFDVELQLTCRGFSMFPSDGGWEFAVELEADEGGDIVDRPLRALFAILRYLAQAMAGVGGVGNVFRAGDVVPVEVEGVGGPVAVVVSQHDQLGHGIGIPVGVGIDHRPELLAALALGERDEAAPGVGFDLFAGFAEGFDLVGQLFRDVQHIDDHGGDGADARVGGGREPGRPAAFGGAGDDEFFGRLFPFPLREFLDAVHGFDETFDHRKEQWPAGVTAVEIADEGLGDEVVLVQATEEGLLGNAEEHGDGGVDALGEGGAEPGLAHFLGVESAATVEEQYFFGGRGVFGADEDEVVRPGNVAPGLRLELDQPDIGLAKVGFVEQFPPGGGVFFIHVGLEVAGGRFCGRFGENGKAKEGGNKEADRSSHYGSTVTVGWPDQGNWQLSLSHRCKV